MAEPQSSRNVSAREAVECIRGPLSNADLMEKFKISPSGYADLLRQLFVRKLITEEDMARRGIRFKVVKRESEQQDLEDVGSVTQETVPEIAAEQLPVLAPAPRPDDDEFLDTVSLTELLSFKPPSPPQQAPPPPRKKSEKTEEAKDEDSSEKKGRFSITGFFKKSR